MTLDPHLAYARRMDRADGLAHYRKRFAGADTDLVYFDGNSLGRPPLSTIARMEGFLREEWGGRLIRGWDESWMQLPFEIGDLIGRAVIEAKAGQTVVGDSTTVLLYKLARASPPRSSTTSSPTRNPPGAASPSSTPSAPTASTTWRRRSSGR